MPCLLSRVDTHLGMPGCLSVGMNAAKSLAAALRKPIVGVHHMVCRFHCPFRVSDSVPQQGHALTPLLTSYPKEPKFPFLTLLISGGHTLLVLATSEKSFRLLATTGDASIGRSFDKVSKLLQLKWTKLGPGDALEKFVSETDGSDEPNVTPITRPLVGQLAFSFAAHHSHVKSLIEQYGPIETIDINLKRAIAREFQSAAVSHLEDKLILALKWCRKQDISLRHVVVSGGVASNSFLRER
jgi:N6-L-threonylcarbamoyladenine synthase